MLLSFVFYTLPVIAAVSALIYLPIGIAYKRRHGKRPFVRHVSLYVLTGYCLSLIYLTLLWYYPYITFRPEWHLLNLTPFVWVGETYVMGARKMAEQLVLNIGMFVPLGLLLPVAFPRLRGFLKTSAAALGTTLLIETLQYFMGRSADIDDVIMNLAGGMTGYLLFYALDRLLKGSAAWAAALGDTAAADTEDTEDAETAEDAPQKPE